jgi:signal transduction histidine kinase
MFALVVLLLMLFYRVREKQIKLQKANLEKQVQERTQEILAQKGEIELQKETILQKSFLLEEKNTELTAIDHEKNYLIGVVAHDLRSPLNHLKGILQILKLTGKNIDDETKDLYQLAESSVVQMLLMISKILDVKAIESKQGNIIMEKVETMSIIDTLLQKFEIPAIEKSIVLHKVSHLETAYIEADKDYLLQVLENLVSNAIKFSPKKKNIWLGLTSSNGKTNIFVRDEGPGLSPDDMGKLFGKFQKLSARPTGGETSIGLGLSIVKKYVEAMNGEVWCESEQGKGTTFFVQFDRLEEN